MNYRMILSNIRIVHNPFFYFLFYFFLVACSSDNKIKVDILNKISYDFRYQNLDSTEHYAKLAYDLSTDYDNGRAEALNNIAFVYIAKMNYDKAWQLLTEAIDVTDNQVELLISDVQFMRLCQRMSRNREFYEYRERATVRLKRIDEERSMLSDRVLSRLIYAETEYSIVNSTYYYYVGLELQSVDAINNIDPKGEIRKDTAQYLNYLYNIGAGGIITAGSQYDINQKEFENLVQCYSLANKSKSVFFVANALEALAEHLMNKEMASLLIANNPLSMRYLLPVDNYDRDIALQLAEKSLSLFVDYGDVYQIAGANRTLASCYMAIEDYDNALLYLQDALSDKRIMQAPDLVASIREQLSVVYSAIDEKPSSDYNRNIYIDLQEQTRQDRSLEARADMLDKSLSQLNAMIVAVLVSIAFLLLLLWLFYKWNNKRKDSDTLEYLLQPLHKWKEDNKSKLDLLCARQEEFNENLALSIAQIKTNQYKLLEHRTRISLVNLITPFIDRIINEINLLSSRTENEDTRNLRYEYILELVDKINEYNDVLTHWIEMRRGEVSMRVETFALQQIFDILSKGKTSFAMKGVKLNIHETTAVVKADRVLTLFMINTLADNARKFTQSGGTVNISAEKTNDYIEISVRDTGKGMSSDELRNIFEHKVYNGHGYGLMNCKGIIEKYRKTSRIFNVCSISAESEQGRGSRFYFRLPCGLMRTILFFFMTLSSAFSFAQNMQLPVTNLSKANTFADSAYVSNVNGYYEKTLQYADSCCYYLNSHYLEQYPESRLLMKLISNESGVSPEILWFRDSIATDYQIILDIRNETAVAALALHYWELYEYNNSIYTQLFKEISADNTLADYCRTMQQSQTNKTIAVIILIIILIMIIPAYYLLYYRHRIYYRFCVEKINQINDVLLSDSDSEEKLNRINQLSEEQYPDNLQDVVYQIKQALAEAVDMYRNKIATIELVEDECRKAEYEYNNLYVSNSVLDNCLSTLKHETMYYPSRIRHLLDAKTDNLTSIHELVSYYRDIHTVLSEQAMRQLNQIKLRMSKVSIYGANVIGDANLLDYMFNLLLKFAGDKNSKVDITELPNGYVSFSIPLYSQKLTEHQAKNLFNPSSDNFQLMLCRQIVRDHSEYTNRRRCGIEAEVRNGTAYINVILASACNQ